MLPPCANCEISQTPQRASKSLAPMGPLLYFADAVQNMQIRYKHPMLSWIIAGPHATNGVMSK